MAFNLNQVSSMSVQELVRDGQHHDLYYYDSSNMFTQSRPTLTNNKFIQNFVSPNSGVNQLIFSPDQGLSDVIVGIELVSGPTVAAPFVNYSLPRGWGYAMINQIAVRYGGSSQYFWSGQQMLMENVIDMQDAVSRDALYRFGGEALMGTNPLRGGANDFAIPGQSAYCYINLPHNTPNGDGLKMNPLPTELLRQPVLVQVEMNDTRSVFSSNASIVPGNPSGAANLAPISIPPVANAYFQVKQVRMINSEDLLTSHHEPSKISYTLPLKYFAQQEYVLQLPSSVVSGQTAQPITVNLTGFRNGGVRSIILWLTNSADTPPLGTASAVQPATQTQVRNYNPNQWYLPENNTVSINGEIFYTNRGKGSLLLDLVNNKQPNELSITTYSATSTGATIPITGGSTSQYLKVDFSQVNDAVFGVNMLVSGKSITNSIVNYQFTIPAASVSAPATSWVLHAVYLYNSSLVFAGGNCEYVF